MIARVIWISGINRIKSYLKEKTDYELNIIKTIPQEIYQDLKDKNDSDISFVIESDGEGEIEISKIACEILNSRI